MTEQEREQIEEQEIREFALEKKRAEDEETIAQYLNRGDTVAEMIASLTEQYGSVPQNIKSAALMLVDTWYQYRSPISGQSLSIVPYTFDILVKPYMIL